MKERPILFNGEMVRAILEGRKTQARRPVKPQPWKAGEFKRSRGIDKAYWYDLTKIWRFTPKDVIESDSSPYCMMEQRCPCGVPGDRLWAQEEWSQDNQPLCLNYKATSHPSAGFTWASAEQMPRWASRITLEVTEVRVERVQSTIMSDICDEGFPPIAPDDPMRHLDRLMQPFIWFKADWDLIYAKRGYSWESNPWVWVVDFERVTDD